MRHLITICLLLSLVTVEAQEYRHAVYQAYLLEQTDSWKDQMDQMDQDFSRTSDPVRLCDLLKEELSPQFREKHTGN